MAWNLEDRVSKDDLRADRQRDFNKRQKSFMKIVGENLASYVCVMIFVLLIGFIWTDIGLNVNVTSFITDSLISVVMFVLADICMAQIGSKAGKLDDEYIKIHNEYLDLRRVVMNAGIILMDAFCDWQIEVEYEYYMKKRCKALKIKYDEYMELYSEKSLEELKGLLPAAKAAKVFALNQIKHIELTPEMLLTDGKVKNGRGGLGVSGEEYIEKHTTGWSHVATTVIFAIVATVPVFTLTQDVSVGRIIYTVFKLAMMTYRMYQGYSRGAKGYNSVEPRHLQAKIRYLYLYLEYLKERKKDGSDMAEPSKKEI